MRTYRSEADAFRRQSYLAREYGITSGVRRNGDRWELIYNPDLVKPHGPANQLRDIEWWATDAA